MKIAGVGVNLKCLPSKEELIKLALKSKEYAYKRNAKELIEKEIKESGLYKSNTSKSKKDKSAGDSDKSINTKRTKSNTKGKK